LAGEFAEEADDSKEQSVKYVFAGNPLVLERIAIVNFFEVCFKGT